MRDDGTGRRSGDPAPAHADLAEAQQNRVPIRVTPEKFLDMPVADQELYVDGVLDALTALAADQKLPREAASCARTFNYGELISGVNSYLHKGLGSQEGDIKAAMRTVPVSLWIIRQYWTICGGR